MQLSPTDRAAAAVSAPYDGYSPEISDQNAESQSQFLNVAAIRGLLWRQKYVLGGIVVSVLLATFIYTVLQQPIYTATSTVRVDPQSDQIIDGQDTVDLRGGDAVRYAQTLSRVITSRALAVRVAERLNMAPASDRSGKQDPAAIAKLNGAASQLMAAVSVSTTPNDYILGIHADAPDPALASRIANAYADELLLDDIRRSFEKNQYAQNYLRDQIEDTRAKLQASERQAISYARANGIISPSLLSGSSSDGGESGGGAPETITASNLSSIHTGYSAARAKRITAELQWNSIAALPPEKIPDVQSNETYQSLYRDRATATAELANLRARYGPENPLVQQKQAQIATLNQQLSNAGATVKETVRQAYALAMKEEDALSQELTKVSNDTLNEQDRRVMFNQLDRTSQALNTQLESVLKRYNEIAAVSNIKPGTMTKLDAAMPPGSASSPDLVKNMLVGLVAGLVLAVGVAVLLEMVDDRIRSVGDVERKLGLRPLGFTPRIPTNPDIKTELMMTEAYSSIRVSIDFAMPVVEHGVLMITSSQAAEGKSTLSAELAKKYAQLGRRVLLLEGDLRKPSLPPQFGLARPDKGIAEVLLNEIPLEAALLDVGIENLSLLPVGPLPTDPIGIISSALFARLVATLRENFDLVIIDSPPVMGLADAVLLSRFADGLVLVSESNTASLGKVKTAIRRLKDARVPIIGAVLTKFDSLNAGESYTYEYMYYNYSEKAE